MTTNQKIGKAFLVLFKEAEYETQVDFVKSFSEAYNPKIELDIRGNPKVRLIEDESSEFDNLTKPQTLESIFDREMEIYNGEIGNDVEYLNRFAVFLRRMAKKAEAKAKCVAQSMAESNT